jgi:hypothetical protein
MTPEGKVKKSVTDILKKHGVYYHMPVQAGYGKPTLDYIGCVAGKFFAIETKAPGKKPTPRQVVTIGEMMASNAKVFVIDGDPKQLEELDIWLHHKTGL